MHTVCLLFWHTAIIWCNQRPSIPCIIHNHRTVNSRPHASIADLFCCQLGVMWSHSAQKQLVVELLLLALQEVTLYWWSCSRWRTWTKQLLSWLEWPREVSFSVIEPSKGYWLLHSWFTITRTCSRSVVCDCCMYPVFEATATIEYALIQPSVPVIQL